MKNGIAVIAAAFVLQGLLALPMATLAQPGGLDSSFSADGKVTTTFGAGSHVGTALAIQGDGKIIVAGYSYNGSRNVLALARYQTNGSLDATFDFDGRVTSLVGTDYDLGFALALQSDGKILLAGSTNTNIFDNYFLVVRYHTDGSLDSTFDSDGIVMTDINMDLDVAYAIGIQSDGKIVVSGYSQTITSQRDFALVRYLPNGGLDSTFDADGIVITTIGFLDDFGKALAIQSDGKIVVAGYSQMANNEFALARYNTDGSIDSTFDSDGFLHTDIGASDDISAGVAIQSDGKILVTGYSAIGTGSDFSLVRYLPSGDLDSTFDSDGMVTTSLAGAVGFGTSVLLQNNGNIVVAGGSYNGIQEEMAVLYYKPNGALDTTVDSDGIVTTPFSTSDVRANALAIQSDGKIVTAGTSFMGSNSFFALARYNSTTGPVGLEETTTSAMEMESYPNPFSSFITVKAQAVFHDATLNIFNLVGQPVKKFTHITGHTFTFHRDNLPEGVYFMELIQENRVISKAKISIVN